MGKAEAARSLDVRAAYQAAQDMTEHLGMGDLYGTIVFKVVAGKVVHLAVTQTWRESDVERAAAAS